MPMCRALSLCALLIAIGPAPARAQVTTTGNIRVVVTDQAGLSVPGAALLHESDVARNDPNPTVGHRLIAYDAGLPKSVIRFSTLHARTASVPCPAELRARRPSPMIDLYRKKTFSTRARRLVDRDRVVGGVGCDA